MLFDFEDIISFCCSFYFTVGVILLTTLYYLYKTRDLPPGPKGLPYFGNWPFISHDTGHLQLEKLGKKYGDLYSLTVTGRLFLHLGSLKAVRDVHITNSECFENRLDDYHIVSFFLRDGLVYVKGEEWKTLRKFFLMQFRERGMNAIKETLLGPMYDTIRGTVEDLKKEKSKSVDIASIIISKCSKIMCQTLFGNHGMTAEEILEANKFYSRALMTMTVPNLLLCGTFAKYFIIPFSKGFREGKKNHLLMEELLTKVINRQKKTFDKTNIRDAVDAYFNEKIIRESKNDPTAKYFTDRALVISLVQIVGDGVYFLSIFIIAFINALLEHPEEQEKIYRELIEVVGVDRNPGMEDKNKLTYTNAFVLEVMRTAEVFPTFISLECTKETRVRGYRIPKGAVTFYNFWAAHMNPEDYEEPEKFNPSRFIVKDVKKKTELLPLFGMGKRSCIGEGFAMIQVFLFLTTIVKNFHLTKPVREEESGTLFCNFDNLNVCARFRSDN